MESEQSIEVTCSRCFTYGAPKVRIPVDGWVDGNGDPVYREEVRPDPECGLCGGKGTVTVTMHRKQR